MSKTLPKVTHVEIYVRAIMSYEAEIKNWQEKLKDDSRPEMQDLMNRATELLKEKIEYIKRLYEIETGVEYC